MSWLDHHRRSEQAASEAHELLRSSQFDRATAKFREAAEFEERALSELDPSKLRTLGILAVSCASLWYKTREYERSAKLSITVLSDHGISEFAANELQSLLQAIWTERSMRRAGISFLPGQVTVSVSGGDVVVGAAPLDLVVNKVQTIQAMFYRTIELIRGMDHRSRGDPRKEIRDQCRPWLFQAAPGSYQFAVAIREPEQQDFFRSDVNPSAVASKFLAIVKASAAGEETALAEAVPDRQYRSTFLKLSRNLAPSGKTFTRLEVRAAGDINPIVFNTDSRAIIGEALSEYVQAPSSVGGRERTVIRGVLRAVHLDKDWLEVVSDGQAFRVKGLQDTIDDVIGPMVNKQVEVQASRYRGALRFIDIVATEE